MILIFLVLFQNLLLIQGQFFAIAYKNKVKFRHVGNTSSLHEISHNSSILKIEIIRDRYLIAISSQKEIIIWNILNARYMRRTIDDQDTLSILIFNQETFITTYSNNRIKIWNYNDLSYDEECNICPGSSELTFLKLIGLDTIFKPKILGIKFVLNKTKAVLSCEYSFKIFDTRRLFHFENYLKFYNPFILTWKKIESFEIIEDKYVAVGFHDQSLKIYDLSGNVKIEKELDGKISQMKFTEKGNFLFLLINDNQIKILKFSEFNLEEIWSNEEISIKTIEKLSSNLFVSGGSNGKLILYNISDSVKSEKIENGLESISDIKLIENISFEINKTYFESTNIEAYKSSLIQSTEFSTVTTNFVRITRTKISKTSEITSKVLMEITNKTTKHIVNSITSPRQKTTSNYLEKEKISGSITQFRTPKTFLDDRTSVFSQVGNDNFFREIRFEELVEKISLNIDLNDCLTNCSNHGKCITNEIVFKCKCESDYKGSKCSIDTRPCSANSCFNQALCTSSHDKKNFKCECKKTENKTSLFYGRYCEKKHDICQNEKCSDQGYCFIFEDKPNCKCKYGFFGNKCQNKKYSLKVNIISRKTFVSIAIVIIISFYILCILNDIANYICKLSIKRKPKLIKNNKKNLKKSIEKDGLDVTKI